MKFKNYLNESLDIDDIIDTLQKDCKPFLNDWKKLHKDDFLYSGRNINTNQNLIKKSVRVGRKPRNTPKELHLLIDDWFYKKFGVRSRSNAIFTTFNEFEAESYGSIYLVFPIGNYTVISSDKIQDLYMEIDDNSVRFGFYIDYYYDQSEELKNKTKQFILNLLNSGDYKKGLRYNTSEQMINCKEYYLVEEKYKNKLLEAFK